MRNKIMNMVALLNPMRPVWDALHIVAADYGDGVAYLWGGVEQA